LNWRYTGFANYWRTLWNTIVTTIAGLGVTLKYLFSRPITIEYPDALPEVPDGWRGIHAYEVDRCIICRLCEQICPIRCIAIESEGKGKQARLLRYEIDYRRCLFCNLCAEVCPVECLWMTGEWDLACYRPEDCVIRFHERDPEDERKKLWPSMKDHPARQKKRTVEAGGMAASEKPTLTDATVQPKESHA
jgi:NADH-quinone oxidoreductase subunit I